MAGGAKNGVRGPTQYPAVREASDRTGTPVRSTGARYRLWILAPALIGLGWAAAPTAAPDTETTYSGHRYVGLRKCASCHKKELLGNQIAAWRKAPHAHAFVTLRSDASRALAKQQGLAVPAHEAPECLRCHVTAFGLPAQAFAYDLDPENGVTCESCHGPGRDYRKKKVMSDLELAHEKGLYDSDDAAICTRCHNRESPTFDPERYVLPDGSTAGFDFDLARKKIPHPIPETTKGRYLEIEKRLKAEGKKPQ